MVGHFNSETAQIWDFVRCMRADGSHYGTNGKCRKGTESPYKDWEVFAEGAMGTVAKNKDGTRVVKRLKEGREWGPFEGELGKRMGELGFSPKVHSYGDDHIEMDMLKGKPLWKDFRMAEDESPMNKKQSLEAAKAIFALHKLGFYHGDMHSQQFVADGNKVHLVDYGLSGKANENPRKVIQDLNKISKLVNWDNPELDGNKYVELVRKHRDLYAGAKKKQAAENEVATQYLKELGEL
jgi:predicted Ser/Thr protein kinase